MKIQIHRAVQIDLHSLFLGEFSERFGFWVQIPLFHERSDIRRRYLHTEIYDQPFAAQVDGRNEPMTARPVKFLMDGHLFSGSSAAGMTPEVSVIEYLPLRRLLRCIRIQIRVIEILCVFDFAVIKCAL